MKEIKKVLVITSDKNLREVLNFCFDGWGYEVYLFDSPMHDILPIKKIYPDVIVVDVHSASKANLEICHLLKDDFITAFIPIITLINKRQLREQLLNIKQGIDDYLIKPPDPLDLRVRIDMAIKRSQYSFHASPLTGLPGGRIIEEVLKDKIKKDTSFSFGYLDIDNFKYYNDVYGYLKGDNVIMQTAYMLYTIIRRFGNKEDFIGHIGGDDFVFMTTLDKYRQACQNFILMFDRIAPYHYSSQDRKDGFIITTDRTSQVRRISLMSVSIAIVNKNDSSGIRDMLQLNEKVAEIKRYLKTIPGSKFMADRRDLKPDDSLGLQIYNKEPDPQDVYKPLGQILLEKKIISGEQLDEALRMHWKKGIILGEIIKELGFLKEEDLIEALNTQKNGTLSGFY
ncbi:MAG: diguanylate cyclase [Candidatus Omnitrophica bacterium]|nr:diguanylate cyclase [Candidatus Omnitrophota bacterium]